MNEADFQKQVTDLAEILGYRWVHFRPAQTSRGWRTPVSGPMGKGWPDLTLVKPFRHILLELKSDTGKVSEEQRVLHDYLRECGVEVYVMRPRDFDALVAILRSAPGTTGSGAGGGPQGLGG